MESVEIKESSVGGKGLFATKIFTPGQIIFHLNGEIYNNPTRESIYNGKGLHIYDKFGAYINHSFNPNCSIQNCCVVAIKEIKKGDELTFNYNHKTSDGISFYIEWC